jgi:hypothetical protein
LPREAVKRYSEFMGIARRVSGWVGLKVARRLSRTFPIVGTAVAVAVAGRAIRRKGWTRGLLDTALDATPFLGAMKAAVESVRGDFFADLSDNPRQPHEASAAE